MAEFGEILKGSYWARESRLSDVLSVARSAARNLRDDASAGFVSLVGKAATLSGRSKPGEPGEDRRPVGLEAAGQPPASSRLVRPGAYA